MANVTGLQNTSGSDSAWTMFTDEPLPVWAENVEIVYLSIVFLLGVPGNLLIIIVQLKNTNHSTTDYLVMSMAMYELYCSGFNAPIQILRNTRLLWPYMGSTFLCQFVTFSANIGTAGSSQMLASIAVDRCVKTCYPLNTFYNQKQAKRICLAIFFTSIILATPYAALFIWNEELALCQHVSHEMWILGSYWGMFVSAVYFSAFLIMFVCYLNIIIALQRRHHKKVVVHKQQHSQLPSQSHDMSRDFHNIASVSDTSHIQNTEISMAMSSDDCTVPAEATKPSTLPNHDNDDISAANTTASPANAEKASVYVTNVDNETSTLSESQIKNTKNKSANVGKPLLMEGRNLNKLTVIMFMISLLYMMTWVVNWVLFVLGPYVLGVGMFFLSFSLPMINCTTNAVLFFAMSSRFRQNAKKLLCGRKN